MKKSLYYSSPQLGVALSYTTIIKIQMEVEEASSVRASAHDDSEAPRALEAETMPSSSEVMA